MRYTDCVKVWLAAATWCFLASSGLLFFDSNDGQPTDAGTSPDRSDDASPICVPADCPAFVSSRTIGSGQDFETTFAWLIARAGDFPRRHKLAVSFAGALVAG